MVVVIVLVVVLLVVALGVVWSRNKLVRLRNRVDNGWAQIDVQLKRRADLIPNLVETVKGYAAHEKDTLTAVVTARNAALGATGPAQAGAADGALSGALRQLFALAESYPTLKADANFRQLQGELSSTENEIAATRQSYNDTVMSYNARVQMFPTMIWAAMMHFTKRELFTVTDPADRAVPKVQF